MTREARRALGVVSFLALLALAGAAMQLVSMLGTDPRPSVVGVRLGMTADEVRRRVDERGSGTWTSAVVDGDWHLEHVAADGSERFEIHEGQLVAVRAEGLVGRDRPASPAREVTPGSVLVRTVEGDRVRITLLSRACPTHRAEAERLVAGGGPER